MATPNAQEEQPPRLAAIEVGTNSVRLVVAQLDSAGAYNILDEEREMSRLGQGLTRTGRLSEGPMKRSLEVIGKMQAISSGFGVRELRAIATSAVREAANGASFCREAKRQFGVNIEVISAEEEARLAFRSSARQFELNGHAASIVDIGGGSVEVVLAAGSAIDEIHSLPLGAMRLMEQFCRSDPLRARHWRQLTSRIDKVILRQIGKPPFRADVMFGSGGTFTTLAEIAQCEREGGPGTVHGYEMTRAELVHLVDRLIEEPLESRRRIPGLNPARADIIVAGAAVVARLAKALGTRRIIINERGTRDGLLLSMIDELGDFPAVGRCQPVDRLDRVRSFARKCHSNERHCEHVAALAEQIFDSLHETYNMPAPGLEILQAAALLHEIGYLINHSKHHKHAYHLIMHSDLPGFSAREVELIANVARYHRRAFPKKSHANFAQLDRDDRRLVRQLSAILRIADGLDRAHTQGVTHVHCELDGRVARILVASESEPQVEIWDANRKSYLFETAFGIRPELIWSKDARSHAARRGQKNGKVLPKVIGA